MPGPSRFRSALLVAVCIAGTLAAQSRNGEEWFRYSGEPGMPGGRLVTAQNAEPKTFNPIIAIDTPSREVIRCMNADLIHINRYTHKTEPALAKSWTVSADGRKFTLELRRGLRFSDGVPFDADDVVFSFKVYLDERVHSPQRDLLIIGGKPLEVQKAGPYTVRFTLAAPYAAAERIFDSVAILPRHLLEKAYEDGKIDAQWNTGVRPDQIAGLGPYRLKRFVPGQRVELERNPYYWKVDSKGQRLPYLDEITFLSVPSQDAQVVRFQAGDTQVISNLSADNFATLEHQEKGGGYRVYDAGPGLEYNFLFFNLNDDVTGRLPEVARKQQWFQDSRFRQAVSLAIDRAAIVNLVFHGHGTALATEVTPGNKLWINNAIPQPQQSVARARQVLKEAGFSWKPDGSLLDGNGAPVEFTILVSSSNQQRIQMATLIQEDLRHVGMNVHVVPLEFRSALDRILQTHDYEAAVLGLGSGDVDPTAEVNVWMSDGQTHLWHLGEKKPATPWEAEIDRLMQAQMVTMNYGKRKKLYDRVQQIVAEQLPIICLASPDILVGASSGLGNFRPAILESYTLWNVEELFWRQTGKH